MMELKIDKIQEVFEELFGNANTFLQLRVNRCVHDVAKALNATRKKSNVLKKNNYLIVFNTQNSKKDFEMIAVRIEPRKWAKLGYFDAEDMTGIILKVNQHMLMEEL